MHNPYVENSFNVNIKHHTKTKFHVVPNQSELAGSGYIYLSLDLEKVFEHTIRFRVKQVYTIFWRHNHHINNPSRCRVRQTKSGLY